MSALQKIIAKVRTALEHQPAPAFPHDAAATLAPTIVAASRQTELAAQFARELEQVGGHACGLLTHEDARACIVQTARTCAARRVALAEGLTFSADAIATDLAREGIEVIRLSRGDATDRMALRERLAACDLGIIEADYAIAATGTFCVVATPQRPSSLTLLPPINFILVDADHILPALADVIAAVGPTVFATRRVALITGPSRTADIEKMIVIGVHGPKALYAAALRA